jgi:4-diphosphocytidyl-2-C-methyl-D-erythritol kinase
LSTSRFASVPCYAKLNLDLRVLHKRPDGYHELRTIFQTISLQDRLEIEFRPAKHIDLDLDTSVEIDDNIVLKAARAVLEYMDVTAAVRLTLKKNIPMGAGLGGGSSNAAAVLIALAALAKKKLKLSELLRLGSWLGSDVPCFLLGGTVLGLGRGTELYPLPDLPAYQGVVVASGIHVSTAEAYQNLQRPVRPANGSGSSDDITDSLTSPDGSPMLGEFQAVAWCIDSQPLGTAALINDFEPGVFAKHPELAEQFRKLKRSGANPARMTGSGSALFGILPDAAQAKKVAQQLPGAIPMRFIRRREYRDRWKEALGPAASYSAICEL